MCSSTHHVGDSKTFQCVYQKTLTGRLKKTRKVKKQEEDVRWRPCPLSLKKKSKEIIKALKGFFVTQKAKKPQSPYNTEQWKVVQRSKSSSLGKAPCLNNNLKTYEVQVCDTQEDKTQDNAHKNHSLVCWSNIFSPTVSFLCPLKVEADISREECLTSLYIGIEHWQFQRQHW